jgi:hypothetical protein
MPLQLLLPTRLFSEIPAPDARLVLLVLVLLALLLKRWRGGKPDTDAGDAVFPGLLAFFLLSLGLWLGTSSNGRYAMPTWMLLGPLLVAGFARLRPAPRLLVYGLGLAVCVQAGQLVLLPQKRFAAAAWTSTWFDVRVPPSLQREPWLFLSLDIQTGAFLFPFLDRGSAFVNLVGQNSLALDRPGGRPLARILGEHDGRVRSLLPIVFRSDTTPAATHEDSVTRQDALLRRLALAVDRADCQTLGLDNGAPSPQPPVFISCRLVAAAPTPPDVTERLLRVDRAFDAIEQQCPALFGTRSPVTDDFGKASYRRYGRDDMLLMESREKVWLLWGWRQDGAEALGSTDDVGEGQVRLDCASRRVIRASTY